MERLKKKYEVIASLFNRVFRASNAQLKLTETPSSRFQSYCAMAIETPCHSRTPARVKPYRVPC